MPKNYRRLISAKLHAAELEVEVMSLALSTEADFVVLDDNAARKTTKYLGLTVTGTLGLLLRAKERGIIAEAHPLVSELRANGFRIDDRVIEAVARLARES